MTQTPTDAMRLVPVEPTSIMTQEGLATLHTDGGDDMEAIRLIYRAMLEAAPRREFQDCGCGLGDKCPNPPEAASASPLPGGGEEKEFAWISQGQIDLHTRNGGTRLVELASERPNARWSYRALFLDAPQYPTRDQIARCIIGPRKPVPETSRFTLDELRQVRWDAASEAERKDALWAADAILNFRTQGSPKSEEWIPTHLHRGGMECEVIGTGQVQTVTGLTDYDEVTIYRKEDGTLWVQSKSEFEDGRFHSLPAAPTGAK